MKKFLVGLLSIFLLLGASILSACGTETAVLELSTESVAIEILTGEEDSGYQIVTASVSGVSDTTVNASAASGYENIVSVSVQAISGGRSQIKIRGLYEGQAQVEVVTGHGAVKKTIQVDVFSTISEMSQVNEEITLKNNYVVKGEENILTREKLLKTEPYQKEQLVFTLKEMSSHLKIHTMMKQSYS